MAAAFRQSAEGCGVVIQASDREGHNALELGDRYHATLRLVYNAIRMEHTDFPSPLALRLAVKAINDTVGRNGLVPTLLVYGRLPYFPINCSIPRQESRKTTVSKALSEAYLISSDCRINHALRTQIPPAARGTVKPRQEIRFYREASRQWDSRFTVTRSVRKSVWVTDRKKEKNFPTAYVIPVECHDPYDEYSRLLSGVMRDANDDSILIHLVDEFTAADCMNASPEFIAAVQEEPDGFLSRDVFCVFDKRSLPIQSNLLSGRTICCFINVINSDEKLKTRLVV